MEPETREFRTPHGRRVYLSCRPGTNDRDMNFSCLDEDEYDLKSIPAKTLGLCVDVGSHVGAVAIGLAADHPDATVIAIEPVPENVELLRANVEVNGLTGRVVIVPGAVAAKTGPINIAYDFEGHPDAAMHRFVGNQPMPEGTKQKVISVGGYTLAEIVSLAGGDIDLLVTDCEGGEYGLFAGLTPSAVATKRKVRQVRGEYHGGVEELNRLFSKTHAFFQTRGDASVGGFVATLVQS
mgnify:CR=1 FL=1